MPHSSEQYLDLFEREWEDSREERIEDLRHSNVYRYRVRTWKTGKVLESEIYPIWNTKNEAGRAKKERESRPAQQALNQKQTRRKIVRLINHNFQPERDMWLTVGYDDRNRPENIQQIQRDIVNYIRRLKRRRNKAGMSPLRYLYVIEFGDSIRPHCHMVMSGDMDRDEVESLWGKGAFPQSRRLRSTDMGLTGLAQYIAGRGKRCKRIWAYSKTLKQPKPTIADHKITIRQVEKLAGNRNNAPDWFMRHYRKYRFVDTERDIEITYSDFVSGAYIYAQMVLRE